MSLDWLSIIKYAGSTAAAAYGVYATVTDFHKEKNGKKTLSKRGKWGIAFLLISSFLNVSSDALKDKRESEAATQEQIRQAKTAENQKGVSDTLSQQSRILETTRAELAETARSLSITAKTTATVLGETRRATDPLTLTDGFTLRLGFALPGDQPAIAHYLDRLENDGIGTSPRITVRPGMPQFPGTGTESERVLHDTLLGLTAHLIFGPKPERDLEGHLTLEGTCGTDVSFRFLDSIPSALVVNCLAGVKWVATDGTFLSYNDLNGIPVRFCLDRRRWPEKYVYDMYTYTRIILLSPGGRTIALEKFAPETGDGCYLGRARTRR